MKQASPQYQIYYFNLSQIKLTQPQHSQGLPIPFTENSNPIFSNSPMIYSLSKVTQIHFLACLFKSLIDCLFQLLIPICLAFCVLSLFLNHIYMYMCQQLQIILGRQIVLQQFSLISKSSNLLQQLFMMETRELRPNRTVHYNYTPQFINKIEKKINVQLFTIHITFDEESPPIPKRIMRKISKVDDTGNIKFRKDQWNLYTMAQVCSHISEWGIPKGLIIQHSKNLNILNQISKINFSSLINLNLSYNNIESIQSICCMNAPNLKTLTLSHNKIFSIKSLRKANFPRLNLCSIGSNRILQYGPLVQLNAPNLKRVYQEHRAEPGWCSPFEWIGKLQTNQLQGLWLRSDNRIWQRKAQNSFQRKFLKRKEITFYVGLVHGVG